MLRLILRYAAVLALLAPPIALLSGSGCGDPVLLAAGGDASPPAFVGDEAGADAEPERGLISYCPTDKCPPGWTTCPNSRFPCDVNLRVDVNNCGACGLACPAETGDEIFACSNGTCTMACDSNSSRLDCDGLVDNGCETVANNDNNCGSCGKKCTDPAKRCVDQSGRANNLVYGCGCTADKIYCDRGCWDPRTDDDYCGNCTTRCDPAGNGAPVYPNSYYGCVDSQCGKMKCKPYYANCDDKIETGCEAFLVSNQNCGACGNACPDGQACRLDNNNVPRCMCPPDKTYCESYCDGDLCWGSCVDLTADMYNCGACGVACYVPARNGISVCNYGACVVDCNDGRADCNNSLSDGCEVNTDSDPRNCGACGHVCDAVAGQACVAGQCVLEPCSQDAGDPTR